MLKLAENFADAGTLWALRKEAKANLLRAKNIREACGT